ncbi:SPLICING REGULATORY GLUTAMINE/LYSINE-RICH PROTEIN 1, partial [Salix purpurea]
MGHIRLHMWCRKEGITWLLLSVMGKLLWGVHSLFSLAQLRLEGCWVWLLQQHFLTLVNQTMPNMPNYSANVSGAFPALLGMTPGIASSASGGAILPGVGASLGEVCREYLYGRCTKTDCKLSHPPQSLLMTLLAPTTSMGTLSMVPMAPSAAAMAAAQAIVAAKALQAHAAQLQAQAQSAKDSSGLTAEHLSPLPGSPDKARKEDALKKTLHVSNLSPLLTVEQLKQLFSFCGTVVECTVADSKHSAYIEYLKPEEATAALALNNITYFEFFLCFILSADDDAASSCHATDAVSAGFAYAANN